MPNDAEIAQDPAILTAEQAAKTAAAPLPPAGHARTEAMKARADQLEAAAEALRETADVHSIDPAAMQIDNEIAQYGGPGRCGSEVSGALPEYVYVWEQADIRNQWGGIWVTQSKSIGWEVVQGNMKEAIERKSVDGTRRWGDTILLRMKRERYEAMKLDNQRRTLARSEGVSLAILSEAERKGLNLLDLTSERTPAHIRQMAVAQRAAAEAARSTMVSTMRQARPSRGVLASELANKRFDEALRTGKVPGLPAA